MAPRQWHRSLRRQRRAMLLLAPIEVLLTAAAVMDLAQRPPRLVRGPKVARCPAMVVQPIGPVAYLARGRRVDN